MYSDLKKYYNIEVYLITETYLFVKSLLKSRQYWISLKRYIYYQRENLWKIRYENNCLIIYDIYLLI